MQRIATSRRSRVACHRARSRHRHGLLTHSHRALRGTSPLVDVARHASSIRFDRRTMDRSSKAATRSPVRKRSRIARDAVTRSIADRSHRHRRGRDGPPAGPPSPARDYRTIVAAAVVRKDLIDTALKVLSRPPADGSHSSKSAVPKSDGFDPHKRVNPPFRSRPPVPEPLLSTFACIKIRRQGQTIGPDEYKRWAPPGTTRPRAGNQPRAGRRELTKLPGILLPFPTGCLSGLRRQPDIRN
jgi:hypothetical protein